MALPRMPLGYEDFINHAQPSCEAIAGVVRVGVAVTLGRDMTGNHVGPHG